MLNVPAEENRVEQLPHVEVAAKERTMKLSYYKDFHCDPSVVYRLPCASAVSVAMT